MTQFSIITASMINHILTPFIDTTIEICLFVCCFVFQRHNKLIVS